MTPFSAWVREAITGQLAKHGQRFLHRASDFNRVRLEREMSGIEESISAADIAFVGLGTSRQKKVIATPHRKQRWLVLRK